MSTQEEPHNNIVLTPMFWGRATFSPTCGLYESAVDFEQLTTDANVLLKFSKVVYRRIRFQRAKVPKKRPFPVMKAHKLMKGHKYLGVVVVDIYINAQSGTINQDHTIV